MYADHHERIVHGVLEFSGDGTHDWRESVRRNPTGRGMEPAADDSHDEHQLAAGGKAAKPGTTDCLDRSGHSNADESFVVDRRQAIQLSVWMRDWVGD